MNSKRLFFNRLTFRFAVINCLFLLLGRSYQHFFFEPPYRAFFLDEQVFGWWARLFHGDWSSYIFSPSTEISIIRFQYAVGGIIALTLLSIPLFVAKPKQRIAFLLALSSLCLFFLSGCYFLEASYQLGQWLEYSAQIITPLILWAVLVNVNKNSLLTAICFGTAFTFLGHGLYALGYYPVPGNFMEMTITSLGLTNQSALPFLFGAGILDMIVVIGVFIPGVRKWVLGYAVLWGFLTAFARLTSNVYFNHLFWLTVHQSLYEFLVRVPHFMVPLMGLVLTLEIENEI